MQKENYYTIEDKIDQDLDEGMDTYSESTAFVLRKKKLKEPISLQEMLPTIFIYNITLSSVAPYSIVFCHLD
jgi:hypothetical protein